MDKKLIYIVEDDESLIDLYECAMQSSNYTARIFESAKTFLPALEKALPNLILLDRMLPDMGGLDILKYLKQETKYQTIPVIIVSAKGDEVDKVKGLNLGADDYIAKPFGVLELMARIKANLRKVQMNPQEQLIKYNNISIDTNKRIALIDDIELNLTLKEFELLKMFMKNVGNVITRNDFLNKIWGYEYEGETRTLDIHINTLRTKIKNISIEASEMITTVRGIGYKLI